MTSTPPQLQIDIVSDVMCPWCVIGYQQPAAALDAGRHRHPPTTSAGIRLS